MMIFTIIHTSITHSWEELSGGAQGGGGGGSGNTKTKANDDAGPATAAAAASSSSSSSSTESNVVSYSMQEELREWICSSRSISTVVGRSYVQHVTTFLRMALNKLEPRRRAGQGCIFDVS